MMDLQERKKYIDDFVEQYGHRRTMDILAQSESEWAEYFIEYVDGSRITWEWSQEFEYKWVGGLGL